jgi:hypothetical protein
VTGIRLIQEIDMGEILGLVAFIAAVFFITSVLRHLVAKELGLAELPTWTYMLMLFAAMGIITTTLGTLRLILSLFV